MAQIKLAGSNAINNALTAMKNGTGTSRTDEYFFQSNDVTIDEIQDSAFKKGVIVNIVLMYGIIYKLTFNLILT